MTKNAAQIAKKPPEPRACRHCGAIFMVGAIGGSPGLWARRFCSVKCRTTHGDRGRGVISIEEDNARRAAKTARTCQGCGIQFQGGKDRATYHSRECYFETRRRLGDHYRPKGISIPRESARHRARKGGGEIDDVVRRQVLERDGYRCQICGVKTLKSKSGTRHPRAPELDHRVPVSKKGGHTWENSQCACHKCNAEKGNRRVVGQTNLFPKPEART